MARKPKKVNESRQVIGVTRLLAPSGVKKLTFLPAPIDSPGPFEWEGIGIRCYYRRPDMKTGMVMSEQDALKLFARKRQDKRRGKTVWDAKAFLQFKSNGREPWLAPITQIPLSIHGPIDLRQDSAQRDKRVIDSIIDEGEGPGIVIPMRIESFQKVSMEIIWKTPPRYTREKWGIIGIGLFLTGRIDKMKKDRVLFFSEMSIEDHDLLRGYLHD